MSPDPTPEVELIAAISDGRAIDWDEAARTLGPEAGARLEALRHMERISEFSRSLQRSEPGGAVPERWGDLILLERIGGGAHAEVFRAWDPRLHREVALKLQREGTDDAFLMDEGRALARIRHANVVTVHGIRREEGRIGLWMELVPGPDLERILLDEGPLSPELAVRLGMDVGSALAAVHAAGLLHRDVKPANIVRNADGRYVLADFGLGRRGGDVSPWSASSGTPMYMAPELLSGGAATARSDLYSLGLVLWRGLTGTHPFDCRTLAELKRAAEAGARPLRSVRPDLPASLAGIVDQAIAPNPSARFASAEEWVGALTSWRRSRRLRPRAAVVAAVIVVVFGLALGVWRLGPVLFGGPSPHPANKAWVLVAEFDGSFGDSSVVAATRDLVMAALDQSAIVATVPPDQIRVALQSSGRPASTRVDAELAQELAFRSSVRTVLEGRVGRLGRGYSIVLRLVDADSSRVVVTLSDAATNEEALIPTVDRITRRLRAELGERQSALQSTRDLRLMTTSSFEAYRAWSQGRELLLQADNRGAIAWERRALELDPDFAPPWVIMGSAFTNLGEPDSAITAFRKAQARSDRLPARGPMFCALGISFLSGDVARTLALSDKQVKLDPQNPSTYTNRGVYLASAGRIAESLEAHRTAEKVSLFGPSQVILLNQLNCLLALGRVEEARLLVPRFRGRFAREVPLQIAAAAGQWSTAESLATALWSSPSTDEDLRRTTAPFHAAIQASRGRIQAADETLRQMQAAAEGAHELLNANTTRWDRLRLALFSRGITADPGSAGSWDSTTAGLIARAVWAAAGGDTMHARRLLATIRQRSDVDLRRQGFFGPGMVEGWLASRAGRWEEVLRHLGAAAMQGEALGYTLMESPPMIRWLVADAYDHLNRPDSAAAYFERAVDLTGLSPHHIPHAQAAFSFGHRRLVLLYARMGRPEEARRHWEIFRATFTRPDADLQPQVEEARAALAGVEARAK